MPGMMDRSIQIMNELRTTRKFGKEIERMSPSDRQAALTDLLPSLENAVKLCDLQEVNEKTRKWIDNHPQP